MNDNLSKKRYSGTATVVLLSLVLFYFPSALSIFSHSGEPTAWMVMGVLMATFYTLVFVVNYFWLVPATLVHNDRRALFFLVNFCIIVIVCALIPLWFETHGGLPRPKPLKNVTLSLGQYLLGYFGFLIRDGIMMVLAVALAYALRLSREHENVRRQELELSAEKRQIELKSLKAQLNPHFLFNTLNNIYALIGFAPERARQALHDLSNMLRFMIYDSGMPYVPLEKEMQFISDYIELMRLRLSGGMQLSCDINVTAAPGCQIAPLLLLTLIENAFKHAAPNGQSGFISIVIGVEKGWLICRVDNSYNPEADSHPETDGEKGTESGVGLVNVERQLGLLYPHSHRLTVNKTDGIFAIELKISLDALGK